MATETTYTALRANLADVLDQVVDQQEIVIVRRKGLRDVALVPATELAGLIETAHLLRSPKNARRLLTALHRAERGKTRETGKPGKPGKPVRKTSQPELSDFSESFGSQVALASVCPGATVVSCPAWLAT